MKLYQFKPIRSLRDITRLEQLLGGYMHVSLCGQMNDVLEGGCRIRPAQDSNIVLFKEQLKQFQKQYFVGCFCRSQTDDGADVLKNHLMWAHYASRHTGVAIEFETTEAACKNFGVSFSAVQYTEEIPIVDMADFITGANEFDGERIAGLARQLLLCKLHDWSYEQEWRLLVGRDHDAITTQRGHNYLEIVSAARTKHVAPLRITGVYLGCNFHQNPVVEISRKKQTRLILKCKQLGLGPVNVARKFPETFGR